MLPILLLLLILPADLSAAGRTAQDCTIGDQWTDKYIRFECYAGSGLVVKGVRAIGCVPSNTATGTMIQPGSTFDEQYFTYSCEKSGDALSYQIINCRDSSGAVLAVGEAREMEDGSAWRCYKDDKGAVKLAQEKQGGCLVNGKIYTAGQAWNQDKEFKATVAGVEQTIGKAVRMECRKNGTTGFSGVVVGCVTSTGILLNNGRYTLVNSLNVKCTVGSNGQVTMSVVDESDVTCTFEGMTVKSGERYTTPDGDVYKCAYGVISKSGCIINGKNVGENSLAYIDGKAYHCNSGAGVVDFGSITGCTLSDGTLKQFYATWINGTEVRRCTYAVKGATVTTYEQFWGCAYNNHAIGLNKIAVKGDEVKKCAVVGSVRAMRDLTTAEYTAWIQAQSVVGSSNVIGGSGGSGSGGDLMADPTTTTTTAEPPKTTTTTTTTTTTKPSTPTTTPEAVKTTTTTTPASPTTTTTVARPTKPMAATSTPVPTTHATEETSTKQPSPKTTKEIETPTDKPSMPPSIKPLPSTTAAPGEIVDSTTVAPDQCHDLSELCPTLAPICRSRSSNLRAIIKNSNITDEQLREIVELVGGEEMQTSSEEEQEEMDEVIRGLTGLDKDEEGKEDCGCQNDACASRCKKRKRSSCKKCQIFKRKIKEMTRMVCPATCGSCDAVDKVPAILKALVRFYTHDCR